MCDLYDYPMSDADVLVMEIHEFLKMSVRAPRRRRGRTDIFKMGLLDCFITEVAQQ